MPPMNAVIAPRSIALALSRSGRDGNDYHRTEGGAALADMNAEGLTRLIHDGCGPVPMRC